MAKGSGTKRSGTKRAGAKRRQQPALGPVTGQGDIGPPERYRHGDVILSEPGADAGVFYRRVTTQSALDRYLARNQISQRQFDAGLKLYRLWRAVGATQRVTLSYGPRVEGRRELSDRQALMHHRLIDILRAMEPLHGVLIHVCLHDEAAREWAAARGDAPQAGVVVLRLALDALADHWKL